MSLQRGDVRRHALDLLRHASNRHGVGTHLGNAIKHVLHTESEIVGLGRELFRPSANAQLRVLDLRHFGGNAHLGAHHALDRPTCGLALAGDRRDLAVDHTLDIRKRGASLSTHRR